MQRPYFKRYKRPHEISIVEIEPQIGCGYIGTEKVQSALSRIRVGDAQLNRAGFSKASVMTSSTVVCM